MPTNITNRVIEQRTIEYDKVSPAGGAFNFRNKLINGNFDIWQRGTSLVSGTGDRYLADRWVNGSSGTTYTVSRQVFALGQTSVSNEPIYFHRTTVSSVVGSTNNAVLRQRIEGVRTLAGKTVTLSFWAKADSNKNLSVEFAQNFGTGGTPTSQIVSIGVRKLSLNNTWQKFTITTNIPTLNSNQVLGIDNNNYLNCLFWFDSGSSLNNRNDSLGHQSGTFDIAQVQLEEGPAATPFEQRPIGLELSLCQRYYEIVTAGIEQSNTTTNMPVAYAAKFVVPKRTTNFTIENEILIASGNSTLNPATPQKLTGVVDSFWYRITANSAGNTWRQSRFPINAEL
jgi:hypothetical protein